ncbi:MAG: hypothetical protein K0Q87_3705 [Neobacillus sp.]|nr:hypothetical protein [Neobacillus sp.]
MVEKEQIVFLSNALEQSNLVRFDVKKLDTTVKNFLPGFQKGREAHSGFEVTKRDNGITYLFTFIGSSENYQLFIYSQNKKAMAELKKIELIEGIPHLIWKYSPAKRDGRNQERKDYFQENFGSAIRQIPIPPSSSEIEAFISALFEICQNRLEADSIGEEK